MVIGNGLLAKTFSDFENDDSVLIFASGVSNSTTTNDSEFEREFNMIKSTIEKCNGKFVYFSTCSIDDESVNFSPYVLHKLKIEKYIRKKHHDYLIFRVSNVIGRCQNKFTILNYLFNAVKNNIEIDLWKNAQRNFIDKDDLNYIVSQLIKKNSSNMTINIASRESIFVFDALQLIERFSNKMANFNFIEKGFELDIDVSFISSYLDKIELEKGRGIQYLNNMLIKYYQK